MLGVGVVDGVVDGIVDVGDGVEEEDGGGLAAVGVGCCSG